MRLGQLPSIPQVQQPVPMEPLYRFGYSITNPSVVVTMKARKDPWFLVDWGVEGPTQRREQLFREGRLVQFQPVWRRGAKRRSMNALGVLSQNSVELPDFNELGQASGPTDKEATVDRGPFGMLESTLTKAADIIARREKQKLAIAEAQIKAALEPERTVEQMQAGIGIGTISLLGAVALVLFSLSRR